MEQVKPKPALKQVLSFLNQESSTYSVRNVKKSADGSTKLEIQLQKRSQIKQNNNTNATIWVIFKMNKERPDASIVPLVIEQADMLDNSANPQFKPFKLPLGKHHKITSNTLWRIKNENPFEVSFTLEVNNH